MLSIIRSDVVSAIVLWCTESMSEFVVMLHVVLVHAQVWLHLRLSMFEPDVISKTFSSIFLT
jgi:hypothetical protein